MATNQDVAPLIFYPNKRAKKGVFRLPRARRRIRMAVVQLGGGARRRSWRMKRIIVGFLRRLRLRLLTAHYRQVIEKLRRMYVRLMKDLLEGTASLQMLQAHTSIEYYFSAPFNHASANGQYNFAR